MLENMLGDLEDGGAEDSRLQFDAETPAVEETDGQLNGLDGEPDAEDDLSLTDLEDLLEKDLAAETPQEEPLTADEAMPRESDLELLVLVQGPMVDRDCGLGLVGVA